MGQTINLTAKDGFKLTAYEAKPAGKARGGLVMIQEIFGVNQHMRKTSDIYAAEGYHVVAPAMFDRVGKDIQLDRKSTRLNSSHQIISYAVFCLKKKKNNKRRELER